MNIAASIVVPVYNAEKYIKECLDSIAQQTFQHWECIIVNDGSTDNSLAIIETFTTKDPRFSCYTIPNSGSAKVPRDLAVSYAQSKWVIAIDADDFIDPNTVEILMARAKETQADIVYLRMTFFHDDKPEQEIAHTLPARNFDMKQVISGREAAMLTVPQWQIGCNGGLFRCDLWKNLSTFKSDVKHMNVDEYDTRELLLHANRVAFAETKYHYRYHSSSITNKISLKRFETLISAKMIEELMKKYFQEDSPEMEKVAEFRMTDLSNRQILMFREGKYLSPEERKIAKNIIKENYNNFDKKFLFAGNKIKRFFFTNGYNMFVLTIFFYYLIKARK